ncbi:unnamed protein product [Ixodes persulcatus]
MACTVMERRKYNQQECYVCVHFIFFLYCGLLFVFVGWVGHSLFRCLLGKVEGSTDLWRRDCHVTTKKKKKIKRYTEESRWAKVQRVSPKYLQCCFRRKNELCIAEHSFSARMQPSMSEPHARVSELAFISI